MYILRQFRCHGGGVGNAASGSLWHYRDITPAETLSGVIRSKRSFAGYSMYQLVVRRERRRPSNWYMVSYGYGLQLVKSNAKIQIVRSLRYSFCLQGCSKLTFMKDFLMRSPRYTNQNIIQISYIQNDFKYIQILIFQTIWISALTPHKSTFNNKQNTWHPIIYFHQPYKYKSKQFS